MSVVSVRYEAIAARRHGDYARARELFLSAAKLGDCKSQLLLGSMCSLAEGGPVDYKEALTWWRLAAAQGNPYAQSNIGNCYHNGYGVEKDLQEATKWYTQAAAQDHLEAKNFLKSLQAEEQQREKKTEEVKQGAKQEESSQNLSPPSVGPSFTMSPSHKHKSSPHQKELEDFFESLDIDKSYVAPFVSQQIKVSDLPFLNRVAINQLIPLLGPRRRLLIHLEQMESKLKAKQLSHEAAEAVTGTPPGPSKRLAETKTLDETASKSKESKELHTEEPPLTESKPPQKEPIRSAGGGNRRGTKDKQDDKQDDDKTQKKDQDRSAESTVPTAKTKKKVVKKKASKTKPSTGDQVLPISEGSSQKQPVGITEVATSKSKTAGTDLEQQKTVESNTKDSEGSKSTRRRGRRKKKKTKPKEKPKDKDQTS